jgi:hypothetical protein
MLQNRSPHTDAQIIKLHEVRFDNGILIINHRSVLNVVSELCFGVKTAVL